MLNTNKDRLPEVVVTERKNNILGREDSMHIDPVSQKIGGRKSILQEIGQSIFNQKKAKKGEGRNASTSKWKRKDRTEKGMELSSIENKQANQVCQGTKRMLLQETEILDEKAKEIIGKKQKSQGKENEWSCIKVEIGSLEWPQINNQNFVIEL